MTLAYQAFPSALLQLKTQLNQHFDCLQPENPGSLWPKTTLGALHDHRTLTQTELQQLCVLHQQFLPQLSAVAALPITQLNLVLFTQRSLTHCIASHPYALMAQSEAVSTDSPALLSHLDQNQQVYSQFSSTQLDSYYPFVAKAGNRSSHYQQAHMESTLVIPVKFDAPLQTIVQQFKKEVDRITNNAYYWFSEYSFHITVRAMNGR